MKRYKTLKQLRVLFVEDDVLLASALKQAIGKYFYAFLTAEDASKAMELFASHHPDVVITDIMMPNRSGLEMAAQIKKEDPQMPIVVLSAYSEPQKFIEAIDVGVVKYMLKPFDPEELLEVLVDLQKSVVRSRYIIAKEYMFDMTRRTLYRSGRYIALSKHQRAFFYFMIKQHKSGCEIVSTDEIKEALWSKDVSDERVRTFIRRLRQKTSPEIIKTYKAQGYALALSPDDGKIIS